MNIVHWLQCGAVALILTVAARRGWALLYRDAIDIEPFYRAFKRALAREDLAAAEDLALGAMPADAARLAQSLLAARKRPRLARGTSLDSGDEPADMRILLAEIRSDAWAGLPTLRTMARVSSSLGVVGAIYALFDLMHGDRGLAGLMAGLAERQALEAAVLSLTLGAVGSMVSYSALAILRRAVVDNGHGAQRIAHLDDRLVG